MSVTEKGLVCQRWNSSDPHHHIISTEDYPELAGGHNFCRNPGGKKKKPWCFTTDADTKFDFCDVPSCGEFFLPQLGHMEILRVEQSKAGTELDIL